jgi:hypothetical protein
MDDQKLRVLRGEEAKQIPVFFDIYARVNPYHHPDLTAWSLGEFALKQTETCLIATAKFPKPNHRVLSPAPTAVALASPGTFIITEITPGFNCPLGKNDETVSKQQETVTWYKLDGKIKTSGAFGSQYDACRATFSAAALQDFDSTVTSVSIKL